MSNEIVIDINKMDNTVFTRFLINHKSKSGDIVSIGAGCVFTTHKSVAYIYNQDIVITYPDTDTVHMDFPQSLGYEIIYLDKFIVPQSKVN